METASHHWEEIEGKSLLMLGMKLIATVKSDGYGKYCVMEPRRFMAVVSGFTHANAKTIAESLLP